MREFLAFRIANRLLKIASMAENLHTLMTEECAKYKIPTKVGTSWFGMALAAAKHSGVHGADVEQVATEAVHNVLFSKKTEEEKKYSEGYVFTTILPALVAKYKAQGYSADAIKKDKHIEHFFEHNGISREKGDKKIDDFYKSDKQPKLNSFTGKPVDSELLGKRKEIEKHFFDSYDPKADSCIENYFFEAVKNESINIVKARDRMLSESLSIVPESRDMEYIPHSVSERTLTDGDNKAETKLLLKDLLRNLKKIDPAYEKALLMMHKGWNIASDEFAKILDMSVHDFTRWRMGFLKALHQVAQKGDVNSEELMHAIKYGTSNNTSLLKALASIFASEE